MPNKRRTPSRRTARSAPRQTESSAGFALGIYGEDVIEENARDKFGPRGDPAFRAEATKDGLVDSKGEITRKGWEKLQAEIIQIERNSLAWMRSRFTQVRDEGHDSYGDLVGSVWFDPQEPAQAYLIDLASPPPGSSERLDMVDLSYSNLSTVAFNGVSDFGASVLGGSITFYNVEPEGVWEEIEATLEREERGQRARVRR